jgi:hypothetical protein
MRRGGLWLAVALGCGATARELTLRPADLPPELRGDAAEVAQAFAAEPNDASVLYQVAALEARAGRTADAVEALRRMAALGSGVDPRARDFGALAADPAYRRIVAAIRGANPPVLRARPAFTLDEADLVPEGIAWSAATQRPADAVTGLFRFRLGDGALVGRYPVAADPAVLVNDVAIAADGSAYATLTQLGAVVRVDGASGRVETFLPPDRCPTPTASPCRAAAMRSSSPAGTPSIAWS